MVAQLQAWVCLSRPEKCDSYALKNSTLKYSQVDLGGSFAVASRGLYATGVSTDLNVTYLSAGGKVGDKILAVCS